MLSDWLLFILLCIFIYLGVLWCRVRRFWDEHKVPHLPPHPILGSLTFFMRENSSAWIRRLYERFRTPYIGIWVFWKPALVINSPELAHRILVSDSDYFRDRFVGTGMNNPSESLSLFMVKDPLWSNVRRRLNRVFTSTKLRSFHDLVQLKSQQLVQRINRELEIHDNIDLRTMYSDYSTDVISIAAFGVDGDATLTGCSPMREITKEYMKYSTLRAISWFTILFLPQVANIFRFTLFPKKTTNYLRKIFRSAVEQRGGYGNEIVQVRDLLDALIKMKQEAAKDGEDISEELVMAQASIFLQGGFDTSAVALTYATYELAFSPHVQEKLYKELVEVANKSTTGNLILSILSEATYLECVIKETLRKYSGWLDRVATKDFKIDQNLTIPAGMPVYVNVTGMHYDPGLYQNPEEFIPERFLPENESKIKPYSYLSFGDGPKQCIGIRFAQQSLRYSLASIVLNFEVHPLPNSLNPSNCELSKKGIFVGPETILSVKFIPRIKS